MANRGPDQDVDYGMPEGEDSKPGRVQRRWGDRDPLAAVSVQKKDDGPATVSAAYEAMLPRWQRIADLLGGTATMRAAGEKYLPPHPYETSTQWNTRLSRATLKNYTLRTLENLTGKAFKDPPTLGADVPPAIVELMTDVDEQGTDFAVFCRAWFHEALAKAMAYVLVDFTRTDAPADRERTLADDERDGVRPFWKLYSPEDVIYQRKEKVEGKWRFTEVRLLERELVPDGSWGDRLVLRIRVLKPGHFDLYELQKKTRSRKQSWERVDGGPMGLADIPFVDYYTARDGLGEGKPQLEDLAYINIEHWQSSSDQRNILTVTRFPILAVSGANAMDGTGNETPVVIGPNKFLSVRDPAGRIYYVEHAGQAIEAGAKDMEALEDQMASYGAEFLRRRPGTASATGRVLDSAEAISPLQAMGMDFKDAIERAMQFTADWLKLKDGGSISFSIKPDISLGDGKDLDMIDAGRDRRDLSRVAWINEMKRRDVLPEEFDAEADQKLLDEEPQPEQSSVSMNLRTGPNTGSPRARRPGNPTDKRGPDKTSTGEKQPVQEAKTT